MICNFPPKWTESQFVRKSFPYLSRESFGFVPHLKINSHYIIKCLVVLPNS